MGAKARRGHRGVGRAEGGHGATVGETGSGQPGCNTVPRVRHLDLDPLRELPCRPAVHGRARGRTDGSIRPRVTAILTFSLALKGASTDVAWVGGLGALSRPAFRVMRCRRGSGVRARACGSALR